MYLDRFAVWTGYFLALASVVIAGLGLVALASGYQAWGLAAGVALLVAAGVGVTVVRGTARHDRKLHRETPHLL